MRVKCVPVTSTAKGIVMGHNSRCLLVMNGNQRWRRWSVNPKHFKENRITVEKNKKKAPYRCFRSFEWLLRPTSKFLICFNGSSTIACYNVRSFYDFKWPKYKFYERNNFPFSNLYHNSLNIIKFSNKSLSSLWDGPYLLTPHPYTNRPPTHL